VKYVIKTLDPDGGVILSPTNMHPAMNKQQIEWILEANMNYGKYPLDF
jgi:hypothetical protein